MTIGVQNHNGRFVANALGLRSLVAGYDPKQIAVVWDAAHEALNGVQPDLALEIVWSHLCMVNLKNAFWKRTNGPDAGQSEWQVYWTSGPLGLASWPAVVQELKERSYEGVICLPVEYTDEPAVDRLIGEDIDFVKKLFADE